MRRSNVILTPAIRISVSCNSHEGRDFQLTSDSGELIMNRIVKKQGAMPPWIELQNNLDLALEAFRTVLLTTYSTNIVRSVLSTVSLNPLPPKHVLPGKDEAWEAREHKFHQENLRQINDLVKRMNAQAPFMARRGLYTLEHELDRVRGDVLRNAVWEDLRARQENRQLGKSSSLNVPRGNGSGMLSRMANYGSSPQLAHGGLHGTGGGSGGGGSKNNRQNHQEGHDTTAPQSSSGLSLLVWFGGAACAVAYFRRPVKNDSPDDNLPDGSSPPPPAPDVSSHSREKYGGLVYYISEYVFEPIFTFVRFLHLFALFVPVILASFMLLVGTQPRKRSGSPVAHQEDNWGAIWWYGFLVKQMERAGPSFIKLGQWAASRADLFPDALCDKMSKLHSNGAPHSLRHTKKVITEAFGLEFDEIFEEFGEKPIGCGAIAQVYRAKLKPDILGVDVKKLIDESDNRDPDLVPATAVAIKVLHPGVRKTIRRDIAIMSVFANAINALPGMQWISLPEEVAVFGEMMNSQLDLRVEASNLDRFEKNFAHRGHQVSFPRFIKLGRGADGKERSESRDVLMEEFEDALPLKWFLRNGGGPYDHAIANIGLDAFLVSY